MITFVLYIKSLHFSSVNKKIFEKEEVNDQQELSAETAFLSMPQFDESLRKFNNMSQMIEIRGQSKQEILYINIDGEERQTYQELYKASRRVASGLQRYGVKAGDIIIFQNENNREYLRMENKDSFLVESEPKKRSLFLLC